MAFRARSLKAKSALPIWWERATILGRAAALDTARAPSPAPFPPRTRGVRALANFTEEVWAQPQPVHRRGSKAISEANFTMPGTLASSQIRRRSL